MFNIYNGRYGNIYVQNAGEGSNLSPFIKVDAELILPKPEKCPFCRPEKQSIESLGMGKPNTQYGIYAGKPAQYQIRRQRYYCNYCRKSFFADHGKEDFNSEKHTLPEFIQFMILEWIKDKNLSFRKLTQRYMVEEDGESDEKHGRSAETIRNWCNLIAAKFDQMTSCDADETLYFSSFHYEKDSPRLYCVVSKIVDNVSRVCTFLENYDDYKHLHESLYARFNDLSVVERVVYDYYPGLNEAMDMTFPDPVEKIIDPKRLKRSIESKLAGIERDYIETLDSVFEPRRYDISTDYLLCYGSKRLTDWIDTLPYEYRYEIRDYLKSLLETPDHFNKSYLLRHNPAYLFDDISGWCEKRSGKKERFENMRLRVLYDNDDFKAKIQKIVEDESRTIYEGICKFCNFTTADYTLNDFITTLLDKNRYSELYTYAVSDEGIRFFDEYKRFNVNDLLNSLTGYRELQNWSVPYFNLAKELYGEDELL